MPDAPVPPRPTGARVIRLTDFEHAVALFSDWQGRFEQLSTGKFEGTIRIVRGGILRLIGTEANQRVLLRGRDADGLFSVYPVTDRNAAAIWQGHRLAPGRIVVHGEHTEVDHTSAPRSANLGASLRPGVLEEAARVLLDSDAVAVSHTWAVASPGPEVFAELNRQLARLLNSGVADPSLLGTPEGDRLEQECVRSLVTAIFGPGTPRTDLSLPARSQVLRRAEEFMRSRLRHPVGAIDLCRELGVSDRTLRLAFRERFGLGPMAYYKSLRLNAVRSRLKSDPLVAVADVAREFGFHHLGNFAADYRRQFGERPSATPRPSDDGVDGVRG